MKTPTLLMLCTTALLAASCSTVPESSQSYVPASGASAALAGASLAGEFTPAGGGGQSLRSYKFALYATGGPRTHDTMTVHALTYRWATGVQDAVPAGYFGKAILFRNSLTPAVTQATWHSPGELRTDVSRESGVTVEADVSIKTRSGTERRVVALRFDRSTTPGSSLQNAPHELIREAKRRSVPLGDLDTGANRPDWKP